MNYWLFKTEPTGYSIDDLRRDKKTAWTGIRNYQARNMLRDAVAKGDQVMVYHSSCEVPGAYGVAEVVRTGVVDETQFDTQSHYYDAKATKENPRWHTVEIRFIKKLEHPVPLSVMRFDPALKDMALLRPGMRLSVIPLSKTHFEHMVRLAS